MEILLPTATSINSPLSDMQVGISLNRDYNVINEFDVKETVNLYDVYREERDKCTLYRLIVTIDPVCTNVLFNPVTIVLNGSGVRQTDSLVSVAVGSQNNPVTEAIYCPSKSTYNGYTYYCGYNIFDNFLFRTELFKKSIKLDTLTDEIDPKLPSKYIYIMDDVISFPSAIEDNLVEYNGWVGFKNPSKIVIYNQGSTYTRQNSSLSFLTDKNNCDMIDMFPTRDMFSFSPIVSNNTNGFSMEYNWNYVLTYPYKSEHNHFLVQGGIPILYVTPLNVGDSNNTFATPVLQIQTAYNNGLNFNDNIEIETQTTKKIYKVIKIVDNTTFVVRNDGNITSFTKSRLRRVVSGIRSEYYIRKFRKLPNWKFESEEITLDNIEDMLESNDTEFTNSLYGLSYAKNVYDDGISQAVFTDSLDIKHLRDNLGRPLTELYLTIVKNNDQSTTYQQYWSGVSSGFELQDLVTGNLWFSSADLNTFMSNYPSVFYLHNLQNNNRGGDIVLPALTDPLPYTLTVNNISLAGLTDVSQPNLSFPVSPNSLDNDVTDVEIYGDIVEFNRYTMNEIILSPVMYRFNTTTRESFEEKDRIIKFHEVYQDDDDRGLNGKVTYLTPQYNAYTGAYASTTTDRYCDGTAGSQNNNYIYKGLLNVGPRPEGYYYQAHNRIQLKTY